MKQNLSLISKQDNWQTPPHIFAKGVELTGIKPIVDLCATELNRKCLEYIDEQQDFLKSDCNKDAWFNWPYSRTYEFLEHAYDLHIKNNISILGLGYNKSDTKWYWDFVKDKAEVYEIRGRINFLDESGNPNMIWSKKQQKFVKGASPYPSCYFVWRKKC